MGLLLDWPVGSPRHRARPPSWCPRAARRPRWALVAAEQATGAREEMNAPYVGPDARRCVLLSRTPPSRAPSADARQLVGAGWPLAQDWPTTSATAAPIAAGGSPKLAAAACLAASPMPLQVDAAEDARTAEVGEALHQGAGVGQPARMSGPAAGGGSLASSVQAFGLDAAGSRSSWSAVPAPSRASPRLGLLHPAELLWAGKRGAVVTVGEAEGRIDRLVQRRATATGRPPGGCSITSSAATPARRGLPRAAARLRGGSAGAAAGRGPSVLR